MLPSRTLTLSTVAAATALALSGCGDDGGESGSDPATLAPAGTPLYVEGAIRPDGELRADTEAAVEAVSGFSNPGDRLVDLLNVALAEDTDLTYEDDIEPWLGERASIAVTSLSDEDSFAVIVESTDSGAAEDFLAAGRRDGIRHQRGEPRGRPTTRSTRTASRSASSTDSWSAPTNGSSSSRGRGGGRFARRRLHVHRNLRRRLRGQPGRRLRRRRGCDRGGRRQDRPGGARRLRVEHRRPLGEDGSRQPDPQRRERSTFDVSTNIEAPFAPGDVSELLGSLPGDSWAAFGLADLARGSSWARPGRAVRRPDRAAGAPAPVVWIRPAAGPAQLARGPGRLRRRHRPEDAGRRRRGHLQRSGRLDGRGRQARRPGAEGREAGAPEAERARWSRSAGARSRRARAEAAAARRKGGPSRPRLRDRGHPAGADGGGQPLSSAQAYQRGHRRPPTASS